MIVDWHGERLEKLWMLLDLVAKKGDEIETGGTMGVSAPFGQRCEGVCSAGAECDKGSKEQSAVGGNAKDRLLGNRDGIPQLSLADTESVLLLAMIDLNLPATEVDSKEGTCRTM